MAEPSLSAAPFLSFWQAGYEGADHINRAQRALAMNDVTGYLDRVCEDYRNLSRCGIRTVRESIGGRLTEKDAQFDFAAIESRARMTRKLGLQVCWIADLVFAGGPSLYAAKARRPLHVRCLPSRVDVSHFERARPGGAGPYGEVVAIAADAGGFIAACDAALAAPAVEAQCATSPDFEQASAALVFARRAGRT
jgi:hypothetical protein